VKYTLQIDPALFRRQKLALVQAIGDSPHPLRTSLLLGVEAILDAITDQLAETGETRHLVQECPSCHGVGRGGPNTTDGSQHDDCVCCSGEGVVSHDYAI
jgi:mono/diheme cytochrome c family protein